MKSQGKKVFVGLSGGVDSAVSATLLKKDGFDVTGVFIKIWSPEWTECTSKEDRLDAMRVCAKLEIPFKEIDLTEKYKKEVVENMIGEYKCGRTPNPDVICNKMIKFGAFFDWAMKMGADFVATGHYAQIKHNTNGKSKLLAGKDKNKDQSYFLWTLKQKHLAKTIFPVSDLEKSQVRKLAKKFGMSVAEKKDSQGLCFVGKLDFKDFLRKYIDQKKGDVLDEKGKIIGWHRGAVFLTIGERHNFFITEKISRKKPYFVIAKNIEKNTITVSENSVKIDKFSKDICIKNVNWISEILPNLEKNYSVVLRYRSKPILCKISSARGDEARIFLNESAIFAPGQSLVIYDQDNLIGGGVIEGV